MNEISELIDHAFMAANTHSLVMGGEALLEEDVFYEGDEDAVLNRLASMSSDLKLREVINYLESTI